MTEDLVNRGRLSSRPAYPIHDLYIAPIHGETAKGVERWTVLTENHHLLRRFGLAEVVRLAEGAETRPQIRAQADEVWAVLDGSAELTWKDLRESSPTRGIRHQQVFTSPTVALVPFGVAFTVRCLTGPVLLARLATHEDGGHPGDRTAERKEVE